jgi:two-component system, chemotaxis family, sensor kinase CheA
VDTARYAELFLTESREHLSSINHALLELERTSSKPEPGGPEAGDAARASVAALFRAVHTIKGMSATMGYASVAGLSHEMEALLDRLRRGELAVSGPLMDALFKAADALEAAIEGAVTGRAADPKTDRLADRLRRLAAAAPSASPPAAPVPRRGRSPRAGGRAAPRRGRLAARGSPAAPPTDPLSASAWAGSPLAAGPGTAVRIRFRPDAPLRGARAALALRRARTLGEVQAIAPSEDTFLSDTFGDEVTLRLITAASTSTIVDTLRAVGDVVGVDVLDHGPETPTDAAADAAADTAASVGPSSRAAQPGQGHPTPAARPGRPSGSIGALAGPDGGADGRREAMGGGGLDALPRTRHVRIDLRRLDALMNLIGELVIARGRLVALTTAIDDPALTETVDHAARLVGNLQDEIMTCRMVPVWQVFDRFPRLVRDAARGLGKQVAFTVDGKDIELDRSMLDEIGDPIVHLLRNAVDHGIESPEARLALGKPAEGRLTLSAARDRSAVLIRVADDGRGIDRDRVLARARDTGLVEAGTTSLSDEEIIRLIARPGFTTAEQVTDLSGRGVGIDAVQARVRALGGSVDIKSAPGQGTTVTVRLPLTLAIMRALLARVGGETYAFPMAHVDETVAAEGAALAAVRGRPVMVLRGDAMPYVRLRELLGVGGGGKPTGGEAGAVEQHVLVVEAAGRRAAVAVDELTGQQDIVVKQFDGVRGGLPLFSGATILGDGAPALIVDVSSLF